MEKPKRIAIIGAGCSGLAAIKCCKEEGFEPVCYEKTESLGGLWRYHDEDIEGLGSVTKTTIINSSKEMIAFSDFPPPKEFPNFMHNSKIIEYLNLYSETFDLLRHIRYHWEVINIEKSKDYESNGCWIVNAKNIQTAATSEEEFDAILICSGHHAYPNIPIFPGQEKFKGSIIHSHSLKNYKIFEGKRVVIVGIGNSGADAAVNCTFNAEQVYLSTRRGSWIFGRIGMNGKPYDVQYLSRKYNFLSKLISHNGFCKLFEDMMNKKFDHAVYNLQPKHRILNAHPTVNDALPICILSGSVLIKGSIERFEENGVIFAGEKEVTKVDFVVLATGYEIKYPFIDSSISTINNSCFHLYKYVIPTNLKHHNLAFIGLTQALGSFFPVAEMQCRWFMQIMANNLKLPTEKAMNTDIENKKRINEKRFVTSMRHTTEVDWIQYLDELSEIFGAKPNLLKLLVTDPKLFWACFNGPCLPFQYRLQGPHSWHGARESILTYEERVCAPLNSSWKDTSKKKNGFFSTRCFFLLFFFYVGSFIYSGKCGEVIEYIFSFLNL